MSYPGPSSSAMAGGAPGPGYSAPPPPPGDVTQPSTIRTAVHLMWAGAAFGLVTIPLGFLLKDEIREQIADADGSLSSSELDTAVTFGLVIGVVAGLVGVGLWVLNAVFSGKGHSWSRILGTVLFGLSVLSVPFNLLQPAPVLSRVVQIISLLISVAAVVFLWRPDSSQFFKESDLARRGR